MAYTCTFWNHMTIWIDDLFSYIFQNFGGGFQSIALTMLYTHDLDLRQMLVKEHGFYWQLWGKDKQTIKTTFSPARWSSSGLAMTLNYWAHVGHCWSKMVQGVSVKVDRWQRPNGSISQFENLDLKTYSKKMFLFGLGPSFWISIVQRKETNEKTKAAATLAVAFASRMSPIMVQLMEACRPRTKSVKLFVLKSITLFLGMRPAGTCFFFTSNGCPKRVISSFWGAWIPNHYPQTRASSCVYLGLALLLNEPFGKVFGDILEHEAWWQDGQCRPSLEANKNSHVVPSPFPPRFAYYFMIASHFAAPLRNQKSTKNE